MKALTRDELIQLAMINLEGKYWKELWTPE